MARESWCAAPPVSPASVCPASHCRATASGSLRSSRHAAAAARGFLPRRILQHAHCIRDGQRQRRCGPRARVLRLRLTRRSEGAGVARRAHDQGARRQARRISLQDTAVAAAGFLCDRSPQQPCVPRCAQRAPPGAAQALRRPDAQAACTSCPRRRTWWVCRRRSSRRTCTACSEPATACSLARRRGETDCAASGAACPRRC